MSSSTIRNIVRAAIEGDIPDSWRFIPGLWTLTDSPVPVLWLEYSSLEPCPAAPGSVVDVVVDLCIVTQFKDMTKAEDAADEDVLVLYGALLRADAVTGVTAKKTVWEEKYLGWRVSATVAVPNDKFTDPADVPEEPEEA